MKKAVLLIIFACIVLAGNAQSTIDGEVKKITDIFAIKDKDTLRMDRYQLPSTDVNRPCIIFVFGGGFMTGKRDAKNYIPFFRGLASKGYVVASIDYRLGLAKATRAAAIKNKEAIEKGLKPEKPKGKEFLATFNGTIDMAVEDLFDATQFILDHATQWNIDKDMLIACGSSAGAITVLHGEYNICNSTQLSDRLPQAFNYAGVISFAGAIFSTKGDLEWKQKPCPIQFFHGDADSNVPYDELRIKIFGIKTPYGFFGSKHIARQMDKSNSPYFFYDIENAQHEIATVPMQQNIAEVETFLDKFVKEKQQLIIHTKVQQPSKPVLKKKFGIKDFLISNGMISKKESSRH